MSEDARSTEVSDAKSSSGSPASPGTDSNALIRSDSSPLSRLRRLLGRAVSHHLPSAASEGPSVEPPPEQVGSYAHWLPILRALPWVLGAVFALSFAWDFPDVTLTVAGYTIVLDDLLRFTSVSGLIGFGTNWLAITMLFRPRNARPIVGQGLVPAQRERVAYRLAQAVSDELINKRIIMQKIHESGLAAQYRDVVVALAGDIVTDENVRRELKAVAHDVLREVLSTPSVQERIINITEEQMEKHASGGLSGFALRAYRLFGEEDFQSRLREAVQRLPEAVAPLLDELDPMLDQIPAHLDRHGDTIEDLLTQLVLRLIDTIDVERIVLENVRSYDEQQLETLLRRTTNEQLNYIKYLGAVLGVFGGLIIWAPAASLVVFTTVGLIIYGLDEMLYRSRSAPRASSDDTPS